MALISAGPTRYAVGNGPDIRVQVNSEPRLTVKGNFSPTGNWTMAFSWVPASRPGMSQLRFDPLIVDYYTDVSESFPAGTYQVKGSAKVTLACSASGNMTPVYTDNFSWMTCVLGDYRANRPISLRLFQSQRGNGQFAVPFVAYNATESLVLSVDLMVEGLIDPSTSDVIPIRATATSGSSPTLNVYQRTVQLTT